MKPLNLDNKPCNPVSSNCVIWQGPTLECINLCTGDTISDTVSKLATELCTILEQTNVSDYDLTCLGIVNCGPLDFKALIQLLIEKICELQEIPTSSTGSSQDCPDCVVTVAPCFVEDGATTMQLLDYVQMIASKVCTLIHEVSELDVKITNLDIRVTSLENRTTDEKSFTLPSILVNCTLDDGIIVSGNAYTIDLILDALVNDDVYGYCTLLGSTGLPTNLLSAVATQCIANSDKTLVDPIESFSSQYLGTWINSPITVADAITNLWVVVCDTYNFLSALSIPETIVTAGDNVTVTSSILGSTTTYEVAADKAIVTAGSGITVTDNTIGFDTIYEVSAPTLPGLYVDTTPDVLLRTVPGLNSSRLCDGTIQVLDNIIYNDFTTNYDSFTGIFTVPEDGVYNIGFYCSITRDADANGWFDPATPGQLTVGIVSPSACTYYCVNNFTPVVISKEASVNGSFTRFFSAGAQICLKMINTLAYDYNTVIGDVVSLSVEKVKF